MAKISINLKDGSLKKEEVIIGIDLGTTNSLAAYVYPGEGNPKILSTNSDNLVPSIVYFDNNGQTIVGQKAKEMLAIEPQNTIYSVKRLLGRNYNDISKHSSQLGYRIIDDNSDQMVKIELHGKFYTPIELSALILKELKSQAETTLGCEVKRAVITVPAYFNDSQRQATRDAGKLAGLDVLRIINEPTAASLAYGLDKSNQNGKTIVVYDLGGGTFDVSILKITNGIFEVLSTNGDTYLGGDDFDRAISNFWAEKHGFLTEAETDKKFGQLLRLKAEKAKISLAKSSQTTTNIDLNGKSFALDLTLDELNNLILPLVQKTIGFCKNALVDAGLTAKDINEVVMVGGSTRTLLVAETIKKLFPEAHINQNINPDEVVALGAAVEADILAGNRTDLLLLDVTPLSLGIETLGGLMDVIIPRNSKIPAKAGRQYTTSVDGQVNIKISVFQGERELATQNRKLAEFILKGIPAMPATLPKVEVTFYINADGILKVECEELRSGTKQEIEVKPQYGLTDEQVDQMLLDSFTNAKNDMELRMFTEAKTEATQLNYTVKRFIEKNRPMLSTEELEGTLELSSKLETIVQNGTKDEIMAATDALNEFTKPFAERMMDEAVLGALKGKTIA